VGLGVCRITASLLPRAGPEKGENRPIREGRRPQKNIRVTIDVGAFIRQTDRTDEGDTPMHHKACGQRHAPDTPCPENGTQELRALAKGLRDARGIERVQIAERIGELAQEEADRSLLGALGSGTTQQAVAELLGITQGAVSQRAHNARKRQYTQQDAR
jgi:DNA-directed RNA polymerase specialized sigma24 family protein